MGAVKVVVVYLAVVGGGWAIASALRRRGGPVDVARAEQLEAAVASMLDRTPQWAGVVVVLWIGWPRTLVGQLVGLLAGGRG